MKPKYCLASLAAITCVLTGVSTHLNAADIIWDDGGTPGTWTDGTNWNGTIPDVVPGTADTAIFGGTDATIDATGAADINALRVNRGVTINGGTLTLGANSAVTGQSGILNVNPGSSNITIGSNLLFNGATNTSGNTSIVRKEGGSGTTTFNGTVTVSNNIGAAGSSFIDVSGGGGTTGTLVFNGAINSTRTTGNTELQINRGNVEFNAANTWNTGGGGLRFAAGVANGTGTLRLGNALALGTANFVLGTSDAGLGATNTYVMQTFQTAGNTVANGINIRNSALTQVLGADITGGGNATYSGAVTLSNATTANTGVAGAIVLKSVQANTTTNFSGLISAITPANPVLRNVTIGDAATGVGTVIFSRAAGNTFTGNTSVVGGTFLATNTSGSATGTGTVGVSSGANFGGTGSSTGAVTVSGNIAPGLAGATGILGVGDFTLASGGTFNVGLNGLTAGTEYDQLNVTGTVTLSGLLAGTVGGSFAPVNQELFAILSNDGTDAITGTFTGIAQGGLVNLGGFDFEVSYEGNASGPLAFTGGNDVVLRTIPEPSSALLGGLGVLALLRRRRA